MRDIRKSEFGHAGQIAPRVAIANSLRPPHRLIIRLKCKALRNVTVRLAVPAMPVPWRWNAGLRLIAGFDGDHRRFAR